MMRLAPLVLTLLAVIAPARAASGPFGGGTLQRDGKTIPVPAIFDPTPDEERVLSALARGDESPDTLIRALIYVSGVSDPAAVERADGLVRQKLALVAPAVRAQRDDVAKGKALLEALHAKVFKAYALDATYPLQSLEGGLFNCVSSAVVYDAFAAALGLKAIGAIAPSHAYSYLVTGGKRFDVQTTIASGFDLRMSKEEHLAFIRRHGLAVDPAAATGPVPNATLFAIAIENRLSLKHDGVLDARATESQLRAQLALTKRLVLLVPSSASYRRNLVGSWQQLASFLRTHGRSGEAFEATRSALESAGNAGDGALVATARQNTIAYAHIAMKDVAAVAPSRAFAVLDEARHLLGCPDKAECRPLEEGARGVLFDIAKDRSDAHDDAGAWALADLVASKLPSPQNSGNLVYLALREGERRWDGGDRTGAERLADEVLARIGCDKAPTHECTVVAGTMSGRWFDADSTKALAWARRTAGYEPQDGGVRHNLQAALHNELVRLVEARDCGKARTLGAELSRNGFDDAEAQDAARSCR